MRYLSFSLAVALLAAFTVPTQAAVVPISGITYAEGFADPILGDANLTSITAGSTYSNITGAIAATGGNGRRFTTGSTPVGSGSPAAIDGTNGLNVATGVRLVGSGGMTFDYGVNVDNETLFAFDLFGGDVPTIKPLDVNGNIIGDFEFTQVFGSPSVANLTVTDDLGSPAFPATLFGFTFDISDFVGTGTLSGVFGLDFSGAVSLDLHAVGRTVIPEPSSVCLTALGLLGMIGIGRRRRS